LLDERKGWAGGKLNASSVLLEPLSAEQSAQLVSNQDAASKLDAAARERIVGAAGGNPFFLEQLTLAARGRGQHEFPPPVTISTLLAARLDRLAPAERAAIECAAVQGAEFSREAVAELLPEEARSDTGRLFEALIAKDLVRPVRLPLRGHETFRFRHELI